jgi:hypothetical protein
MLVGYVPILSTPYITMESIVWCCYKESILLKKITMGYVKKKPCDVHLNHLSIGKNNNTGSASIQGRSKQSPI